METDLNNNPGPTGPTGLGQALVGRTWTNGLRIRINIRVLGNIRRDQVLGTGLGYIKILED